MLYGIPPKANPTRDSHAYLENIFTQEEINKILSLPQWLNTEEASIGGSSGIDEKNNDLRRTEVSWIYIDKNTEWIWKKLSDAIAFANARFFSYDLTGFYEPIQIGIYKENEKGYYDWHTDTAVSDNGPPRKLSMCLSLSDPSEYEGGDLLLKITSDQPIKLDTPKGRAWFFPSTTLHAVTPVTKGIRRSLVLWVHGPAFR